MPTPHSPSDSRSRSRLAWSGSRPSPPGSRHSPPLRLCHAFLTAVVAALSSGPAALPAADKATNATEIDYFESPRSSAANVEDGRQFWCYQLPSFSPPPNPADPDWSRTPVDRFLKATMDQRGVTPADPADPPTRVRRLYYDLTGLPPTPEELQRALADDTPQGWAALVDRLLASPRFGERWGRHWLDVARYAESVTLRGLVFPEAWRYRDYVIEAFNEDRSYADFIREQVAGDLLPAATISQRQRQLIATTFLTLGNINYEEQDKKQLEMDAVDEQLDVIGKGILAQTVACARCHDHKFDPIPTADYYALAGILKSAQFIKHANVSGWVDRPLPLSGDQEAVHAAIETAASDLEATIASAKNELARLREGDAEATPERPAILRPQALQGIVVDSAAASAVGEWMHSQYTQRYIGDGYLHDLNQGKGAKTLTFLPELTRAGLYEVRFAYTAGGNRDRNVPITVFSADGETVSHVDEQLEPTIEGRFVSLGRHRFELNGQGFVRVSNEGTTGHVIADAVQFLPADATGAGAGAALARADDAPPETAALAASRRALTERIAGLEGELKRHRREASKRPMAMAVEDGSAGDLRVHVRGSVHTLGDVAPRGFLQAALHGEPLAIVPGESGRLALANWLAGRNNPLTARVMVNRVWHWVFGAGLVRSTDNFGTTGDLPSHPALLDWLAVRFMEEAWSIKWLLRELLTTRAYRLESTPPPGWSPANETLDPENRLLWRMIRRRLDAEAIRDTLLYVSGSLDGSMGGRTFPRDLSADYGQAYDGTRRSVYVPVFRNALPEIFAVFDFADPSTVIGRRDESTVATQALYMMNHPFVRDQARAAAQRFLDSNVGAPDLNARIDAAYRLALGRPPSAGERDAAAGFLSESGTATEEGRLEAWTQFAQALFGSVDFRMLD